MKAKDLRIGNLVYLQDGVTVSAVRYFQTRYNVNEYPEDLISGIPLTEKWLVKFGFKKSKAIPNEKFCYLFEDKGKTPIEFYVVGKGANDVYTIYDPINRSNKLNFITDNRGLNFVHQLQNLYFALAGSELIITKTKERYEKR
jgi:hypothetical protein